MRFTARRLGRSLLLCFSLWLIEGPASAQSLQVIELQHRTAEQVMPVLQPLLEPGAALSGQNDKLFVRASAENVRRLREALAAIDRPARQLRVSVRQGSRAEFAAGGVAASGTVRTERGGAAVNETGRTQSGATVRASEALSTSERENVSSVLVLEGDSAFIATGESVPIVTAVAGGIGRRGGWGAVGTTYRELRSGFRVTPRVRGETVVLDISQQSDSLENGRIETQQLATQATAALGQWVQLGGVVESASRTETGIAKRRYETRSEDRTIWVKVEQE